MRVASTSIILLVWIALTCTAADKPVKVFLLVGQSNMQGKGSTSKFKELATTTKAARYGQWVKDGAFVKRDDVFCALNENIGKLTVGFGHPPQQRMGPELGFGDVVGNALEEPVVLLKTCWGGQSLAVDFRPPSSGHDKPLDLTDGVSWKPGTQAWAYKEIFNLIHKRLDNLGATFPELKDKKWEFAGLVWFQGWNDHINAKFLDEYEKNLANFVRDIRKDLKALNLPIVIGESGFNGKNTNGQVQKLRAAQKSVADMPEFKGTVAYATTAEFWRDESHGDGGYHFNGNCETYYDMGEAFGKAMMELLKK